MSRLKITQTSPLISKRQRTSKASKILSLFSGCGGMDLGFEGDFEVNEACLNKEKYPEWFTHKTRKGWYRLPKTGFQVVFANDILKAAKSAWVPYFSKRGVANGAFYDQSIVDLVKASKTEKIFPQDIDIVTGGFPCQDFSVAGKRKGFSSHKSHRGTYLTENDAPTLENRGLLYMWMKSVVATVRPKVFVAENVRGLVSLADAKSIIENDFRKIGGNGYIVINARVLNAADYGVPQSRQRVFFIGLKREALRLDALKILERSEILSDYDPYPKPTHGKVGLSFNLEENIKKHAASADVLLDLPEPEQSKDLAQKIYSKAKYMGRHCQGQAEIKLSELGPTIRAEHHGNIEFRRLSVAHGGKYLNEIKQGLSERRLSVRECARLQTFPDDFEFVRPGKGAFSLSGSDGYKVIGNAVPPLLAYHIASRLKEVWPKLFKGK